MTSCAPKPDTVPVKLLLWPPDELPSINVPVGPLKVTASEQAAPSSSVAPAPIVADPPVGGSLAVTVGPEDVGTDAFDVGTGGTIVYDPPVPTSNASVPTSSGQTSGGQGRNFTGTGSGFEAQDIIDQPGMAFDAQATLGYLPGSNQTEGTLPFMDGAQSAKVALLGNYMASSFASVTMLSLWWSPTVAKLDAI